MASEESSAPAGLATNESCFTYLEDLLREIYIRIDSIGDRLAFESVCRTWQSLTRFRMQYHPQFKYNDRSPCLLFQNGKLFDPIRSLQCCNPLSIPAKGYPTVCAALDDKVIVLEPRGSNSKDIYLWNPFTKEKTLLPYSSVSHYGQMHICSPPLTVICPSELLDISDHHTINLKTIMPGEVRWTRNEFTAKEYFGFSVSNAVFCQGKYYFLGCFADLLIHDPEENKVYTIYKPSQKIDQKICKEGGRQYLLESDGMVLAVFVGCDGSWIRVCRWDLDKRKWKILSSLGNKMLFVSHAQSICVTATLRGTGNKIYFPRFVDDHCLFYSMDTKKYHTFKPGSTYPSFHGSESFGNLVWVRPSTSTESTKDGGWHTYSWSLNMQPASGICSLLSENCKMDKVVEATKMECPPTKRQSYPWLIMIIDDGRTFNYSITDDWYSTRYIPELKNQEICGFYQGWIFLQKNEAADFSLLNISTMEKIQLPPLSDVESFVNYCVLSSPTTMDRSCRVVCFERLHGLCQVKSCYIGDTEFVTQELPITYTAVTNINGKLYVLSDNFGLGAGDFGYKLFAADLLDPDLNFTRVIIRANVFNELPVLSRYGKLHYLVESCGELLCVLTGRYGKEVSDVKILRADFKKGEWVVVDNIGDQALFIDQYNAFSSEATSTVGLRRNCVYLVRWEDRNLYIFDMETQGIGMYLPCNRVKSTQCLPYWVSVP